jgi:hypothetical protein
MLPLQPRYVELAHHLWAFKTNPAESLNRLLDQFDIETLWLLTYTCDYYPFESPTVSASGFAYDPDWSIDRPSLNRDVREFLRLSTPLSQPRQAEASERVPVR